MGEGTDSLEVPPWKNLDMNRVSGWVSAKVEKDGGHRDSPILPKDTGSVGCRGRGRISRRDMALTAPSCCPGQGGGLTSRTKSPEVSGCAPVPSVGEWSEVRSPLLAWPSTPRRAPHLHIGVHRLQSHLEVYSLD